MNTTPTGYPALDRLLGLRRVWTTLRDWKDGDSECSYVDEPGGFLLGRLTVIDGADAPMDLVTVTPGAQLWDGIEGAPSCVSVILGAPRDRDLARIVLECRRSGAACVVVTPTIETKGLKFFAYQRVAVADGCARFVKDMAHGLNGVAVAWPGGELLSD